jgi:hypothetical protein
MKTLKALKHLFLGYRLHPKEHMRLMDLWGNVRAGIITILLVIILFWVLNITGCFNGKVSPEDFQ